MYESWIEQTRVSCWQPARLAKRIADVYLIWATAIAVKYWVYTISCGTHSCVRHTEDTRRDSVFHQTLIRTTQFTCFIQSSLGCYSRNKHKGRRNCQDAHTARHWRRKTKKKRGLPQVYQTQLVEIVKMELKCILWCCLKYKALRMTWRKARRKTKKQFYQSILKAQYVKTASSLGMEID